MALETALTINDLVATNPGSGDPKSQGDDHIRTLKTVLKQAFAGLTGAVIVSGTDGGVADAYTLTPSTPLLSYGTRMLMYFSPVANNTGAVTMNISGLGAKAVKAVDGSNLSLGDLIVGYLYTAIYNGTEWRLTSITRNYVLQLAFAASGFPGQEGNAGKVLTTDGTNVSWTSMDLRGGPTFNKGSSGTAAQVINYADGEGQTLTATGAFSMSATGFPSNRIAGILLRAVNFGSQMTSTGINWIKSDGTTTTNFSAAGITLQAAGTDLILLISYGDGTVYGKVAR